MPPSVGPWRSALYKCDDPCRSKTTQQYGIPPRGTTPTDTRADGGVGWRARGNAHLTGYANLMSELQYKTSKRKFDRSTGSKCATPVVPTTPPKRLFTRCLRRP
ncbi:hypothetical protein LSAT2_019306 [Lamellibrachia satsuma]|nr:hypothetical protein LSAT2_019306 [Lamellibrachia satsuma]